MTSDLELQFHERMRQVYDQAKEECGYTATRFMQMVNEQGGLSTAKRLINSTNYSEGLTRLWELKRLDISMEATVLQQPWRELFTEDELKKAGEKLAKLGFKLGDTIS